MAYNSMYLALYIRMCMASTCIIMFVFTLVNTTESSTPSLKDLFEVSLPHATYWKEIGVVLGLSSKDLNIIEYDNVYKAVPCCLAMLQKWLETDLDHVSWPEWYKALAKVENTGTYVHAYTCNKARSVYISMSAHKVASYM